MKPLFVHENGRCLMFSDGTPYFIFADTAWTMLQRLTLAETRLYFETRKSQGFNTVFVCALSELDGLRAPNRRGDLPFLRSAKRSPLFPICTIPRRTIGRIWMMYCVLPENMA